MNTMLFNVVTTPVAAVARPLRAKEYPIGEGTDYLLDLRVLQTRCLRLALSNCANKSIRVTPLASPRSGKNHTAVSHLFKLDDSSVLQIYLRYETEFLDKQEIPHKFESMYQIDYGVITHNSHVFERAFNNRIDYMNTAFTQIDHDTVAKYDDSDTEYELYEFFADYLE